MKRKILNIWIIMALVLSFNMVAAVPAGTVLALDVLPAAVISPLSAATAVPGSVWAWGSKGATGLGDSAAVRDTLVPVAVSGLSGVVDISAGMYHGLALKSDGSVWTWGLNSNGQLGDGTTTNRNIPVKVTSLSGVTAVAAGYNHSLALKSGTVLAWGSNTFNQLGFQYNLAAPDQHPDPVLVSGLTDVTAIAAGGENNLALKSDGTVWAWGSNRNGNLGNGSNVTSSYIPVQVKVLTGVTAIAVGQSHNLALKSDGTVWAWGYNFYGQLGIGSMASTSLVPVQVIGLTGVTAIAAGNRHSMALKADGTVWAWGRNDQGQLGIGSIASTSLVPVQVNGLTGVTAIGVGDSHSLAVNADGTVWAWGNNYYGQLGNNSTIQSAVPVQVSGLTGVTAVTGRYNYSLALKTGATAISEIAPIQVAPPPATTKPLPATPTPIAPPILAQTPGTTATSKTTPILGNDPLLITKSTPRSAPAKYSSGILIYMSPERIIGPGAGGVFSVSVWAASGSQAINSGDLFLSFDATALEIISITPGNVFGITPMVVQNDFNNSNGTARLVAAHAAGGSASGGTPGAPPPPPPPSVAGGAAGGGAATGAGPATGAGAATTGAGAKGAATGGAVNAPPPASGAAGGAADAVGNPADAAKGAAGGGTAVGATGATAGGTASSQSDADRVLAAIIAAANAEADRILAGINAAANAVAGALGLPPPVADAAAPTHHAAEAVASTYHAAEAVPGGGAGGGAAAQPPTGAAYGGAAQPPTGAAYGGAAQPPSGVAYGGTAGSAGPPSGTAYFGSAETGYVASYSLVTIKFRVKPQASPGDYQVSITKAGLADAKGQDIQIKLITGSTITIGGQKKMGDLDGSGLVDYRDLGIFGASYGTSKGQIDFNNGADLNGDSVVDYRDLAIFGANYGK